MRTLQLGRVPSSFVGGTLRRVSRSRCSGILRRLLKRGEHGVGTSSRCRRGKGLVQFTLNHNFRVSRVVGYLRIRRSFAWYHAVRGRYIKFLFSAVLPVLPTAVVPSQEATVLRLLSGRTRDAARFLCKRQACPRVLKAGPG